MTDLLQIPLLPVLLTLLAFRRLTGNGKEAKFQ
jgi:hypothetical protein